MKATSESSSNLGSPISMRDVLIRVWDQGYQSPHFRRSRFRPDGITFRITIACRQFPYSAAFTTNINWKKSRLEKFRMSYLRSTPTSAAVPAACQPPIPPSKNFWPRESRSVGPVDSLGHDRAEHVEASELTSAATSRFKTWLVWRRNYSDCRPNRRCICRTRPDIRSGLRQSRSGVEMCRSASRWPD